MGWAVHSKKGFGLVEIVVAAAIVTGLVLGVTGAMRISFRAVSLRVDETRVQFLLEETLEALRFARDDTWSGKVDPLSVGTSYYLDFSGGAWVFTTTDPGSIDNRFTRTLTLHDVYRRDSDDDIIPFADPDPKTLDPDTLRAEVIVTWALPNGGTRERRLETYITNLFSN